MPTRKHAAAIAPVLAVLLLAGCGKSVDDVFSNLNGTTSSSSSSRNTSTSDPDVPGPDTPPNYADNHRARQPREMSRRDEKDARQKANEVRRVLDGLRRRGRVSPAEVQPVLAQLAAPSHLSVAELLNGTGTNKVEGSTYGIWIGDTACVTGATSKDRVWADANGRSPETGCMPPPSTH